MRTTKSIVVQLCCPVMLVATMSLTQGCGTIFGAAVGSGVTYEVMHHNNMKLAAETANIQSNLQMRIEMQELLNAETAKTLAIERSLFSQALTKMSPPATKTTVTQIITPVVITPTLAPLVISNRPPPPPALENVVGTASAQVGYGNEPYTKPARRLHQEPQHKVDRNATLRQAQEELAKGEKALKELELQLQKLSQ